MSPAMMRTVGVAMARDPDSWGVNLWTKLATGQNPVPELRTAEMRSALNAVANAMVPLRR